MAIAQPVMSHSSDNHDVIANDFVRPSDEQSEMSWEKHSRSNCRSIVTIKKSNGKAGHLLSLQASISVTLCRRKFEWFVSINGGILDVTPISSCFTNVMFSPYEVTAEIVAMEPDINGSYDLNAVAGILTNDFLSQQERNVAALAIQHNSKTVFTLELLRDISNVTKILWIENDMKTIICDFPLLSGRDSLNPSATYLYDTTKDDPIYISLMLKVERPDSPLDYKVVFPRSMPCSRNLDFQNSFQGISSEDISIIDILPHVENKVLTSIASRKLFLEELQRFTAILEYDAIDFAFILIALRMKYNNMYTICTVEIRLAHSFPMSIPLLSLHDLQNSFSAPVDTSSIKLNKSWGPEKLARELLLLTSSVISQQAFGINILSL